MTEHTPAKPTLSASANSDNQELRFVCVVEPAVQAGVKHTVTWSLGDKNVLSQDLSPTATTAYLLATSLQDPIYGKKVGTV